MNRLSPEWFALKKKIEAEIEAARGRLEQTGLPLEGTEFIRGEIAALRGVIKLVEPDAPITEPTGTDYSRTTPQP